MANYSFMQLLQTFVIIDPTLIEVVRVAVASR
jgi:hypothetical protein